MDTRDSAIGTATGGCCCDVVVVVVVVSKASTLRKVLVRSLPIFDFLAFLVLSRMTDKHSVGCLDGRREEEDDVVTDRWLAEQPFFLFSRLEDKEDDEVAIVDTDAGLFWEWLSGDCGWEV